MPREEGPQLRLVFAAAFFVAFRAGALFAGAFFAGPRARRSASSSAARSIVTFSTACRTRWTG